MTEETYDARTHRKRWEAGLESEIAFWDEWIRTNGQAWPADFRWRMNTSSAFQPHLATLLAGARGPRVRVLDVGAGPLTILGKVLEAFDLEITAIDPLAEAYGSLLAKYNVVAPIPTIPCEAEDLLSRFEENSFDLVHARNCLDHSYDPVRAFRQMIAVLKHGHWVHAEHRINEGCSGAYQGLHQWNFDIKNDHFIIWNQEATMDMNVELRDIAEMHPRLHDGWVFVNLCKI